MLLVVACARYYLLFNPSLKSLLDVWGIGVTGTEELRCASGGLPMIMFCSLLCRMGFCSRRLFSEFSFGTLLLLPQFLMNVLCILVVWVNLALTKSLVKAIKLLALRRMSKLGKVS